MHDLPRTPGSQNQQWFWLIIAGCCVVLIFLLRGLGVILALLIALAAYLATMFRPDIKEVQAIEESIRLSLDDIRQVATAYDEYLYGHSVDNIADRKLYLTELSNPDSTIEEVQRFHYLLANSERFIRRIESRLNQSLSIGQLESLLEITDRRSEEFAEAWMQARRAARRQLDD